MGQKAEHDREMAILKAQLETEKTIREQATISLRLAKEAEGRAAEATAQKTHVEAEEAIMIAAIDKKISETEKYKAS